jgi:PAS domain S-box-containing protein
MVKIAPVIGCDVTVATLKQSSNTQFSNAKAENGFPIIAVGASAGGLNSITKLLENLPIDTGMAFAVIQHLGTGQESLLADILSRSTKMSVFQVTDGMKVEKDHVYVITPGTTMTLKNGCLRLVPKGSALKPINDFMISIASEQKTQAIGIVMSGTGNDGTEGLKAIKAEGGITFAQEPATAQYPDMPKNAIIAETPDFILSPEQIAKELVRIAQHPQLIPTKKQKNQQSKKAESDFKKIIMLLKTTFGVDFTHYKETTINRRITRRMVINKTKNLKEYIDYLRTHPNEPQALFDDLLIGVTSFFREPKTFEALKEKVFPELIKNKASGESIRVWIPGCSTGEEAYSVAIAIQEFLEEKVMPEIKVQIFGTDANAKNIDKARQGIYLKIIEENVSENQLRRFFNRQNGNYQITKPIRDMCIFAKQDITNDPPFSNLNLIICRNVLIYFDPLLHEKVFPIFHYGLKSNGFLVLGESESVGKFQYLFEAITTKGIIYRKKQAQPQILIQENFVPQVTKKTLKTFEKVNLMTVLEAKVDNLITSEYGPATLLVNSNLDILVFRGDVAPYLSPESGVASFNVTKIVRKELRSQVQTALFRAKKEKKTFKETVHFKQKGQQKTVSIEIRTLEIPQYEGPFYLVLIIEKNSNDLHLTHEAFTPLSSGEAENLKDRQIRELREDLDATKQSLQALVEGEEATNEELRASMEELQSSNEELQSTNEELETAKEELQSGNEELQTLNEELKNRNHTLARLNDDLANLQTNLDIAVVIVDSTLKIKRFTVAAQELLRISPSDVGGSIANITPGVYIEDLGKMIKEVIDKLTPISSEVEGLEGHFYEMRIRPYLTGDKKIDGAFLSFTDITKRKKAEDALIEKQDELQTIIDSSQGLIFYKDRTNHLIRVNKAFAEIMGLPKEQLEGRSLFELYPKEEAEAYWIDDKEVISSGKVKVGIDEKMQSKQGQRWVQTDKIPYRDAEGNIIGVIGFSVDITERKKAQEALIEINAELEARVRKRTEQVSSERQRLYNVLETLPVYVILLDKDYRVPFANKVFRERFGESHGRRCHEFLFERDSPCDNCETYKVLKNNKNHHWEWTGPDNRDYDIYDFPFVEADGSNLILEMGIDITERKRAEKQLHDASMYSRSLLEASLDPLVTIDSEGKITDVNKATEVATGYSKAELIGSDFSDYFIEPEKAKVGYKQVFTEGFVRDYPLAIRHLSGKITEVLYNAAIYTNEAGEMKGVFAAARDITELRKAEARAQEVAKELKDAERLAAIGSTAGMVGHDIRNPLQAITSDVYLAKTELVSTPESEEKKNAIESLDEIENNVVYINKIVQDLQDFARPLAPKLEQVDLEKTINQSISTLTVPQNIKIEKSLSDLHQTVTDPAYIQRIVTNLCNNAIQAMPKGGTVTITAYKKDNKALISVEDTGEGIPESVRDKLFTPLVTTKAKGQGFGLAAVKRFTEALGGSVSFKTEIGEGTEFILEFPIVEASQQR